MRWNSANSRWAVALCFFLLTLSLSTSCEEEAPSIALLQLPPHFPQMPMPEDNALTAARVELGRRLFYETALSRDSSLSCASCHLQSLGFTDGKPRSVGIGDSVGLRNSPALINVGYDRFYFRDGGVTRLEGQAIAPIVNPKEMGFSLEGATERLSQNLDYQALAKEGYGRGVSPYVIVRALAAFQRTLVSGDSPFDAYFYEGKKSALTTSQVRGKEIFFGKGNCNQCHEGFNFTNFGFENNGLYDFYEDRGRERISLKPEDNGKFKVPTLRNVEKTSPYMHDGSLLTLEAVVAHYNAGGKGHRNQSPFVQPLGLTEQEQTDLVNFLKSLTDQAFLQNPNFN